MYIYLVKWFCIEQRYIQQVIAHSDMKNVAKTALCNFPSITSACSQEQAWVTDVERKCNSQSLFYIFLDSVLGIFTFSNGAYISQGFCIEHYIRKVFFNALTSSSLYFTNPLSPQNTITTRRSKITKWRNIFKLRLIDLNF